MGMRQAAVRPRPVYGRSGVSGAEDAQRADPHERTVRLAGSVGVLPGPLEAFLRRLAKPGTAERRGRCTPDVKRRRAVPVQIRIEGPSRVVAFRLDHGTRQHQCHLRIIGRLPCQDYPVAAIDQMPDARRILQQDAGRRTELHQPAQ